MMDDDKMAVVGDALSEIRKRADALDKRQRLDVTIGTDKGTVAGTYDPMFKTVTVKGATFPEREITVWMKLFFGVKVHSIVHVEK